MEELHVERVDRGHQRVAVAVREEVGAVDPGELLVDLEVADRVSFPLGDVEVGDGATAGVVGLAGRKPTGAEPDEGPGAIGRAVVRVVERVRPVAGLRGLLDPQDAVLEVRLRRGGAGTVGVALLDDRHGYTLSSSAETLHRSLSNSRSLREGHRPSQSQDPATPPQDSAVDRGDDGGLAVEARDDPHLCHLPDQVRGPQGRDDVESFCDAFFGVHLSGPRSVPGPVPRGPRGRSSGGPRRRGREPPRGVRPGQASHP